MPTAPATDSKFACPDCAKTFRWKPDLAGKRVKCPCGGKIEVPTADPALAPAGVGDADADGGEYDLADAFERAGVAAEPAVRKAPPTAAAADSPGGVSTVRTVKPAVAKAGGGKPAAKGGKSAVAGPGAFAGIPRPTRPVEVAESSGGLKVAALALVALAVVVGAVFGLRHLAGGGAPAGPALGEDATVREMVREESGTEARKWLSEGHNRVFMGQSEKQSAYKTDQWYDLGATQVIAFGGRMSTMIALELPADAAKRKALFDWEAQWHREMGKKVATDVGQQYLLLRMRI